MGVYLEADRHHKIKLHTQKEDIMEDALRHVTFFFVDDSKMKLAWPQQGSDDRQIFAQQVHKCLEAEKFMAEVEGQLVIIPMHNVKYITVSPSLDFLPQGVILNAHIVE
jgi:hypothetical protein